MNAVYYSHALYRQLQRAYSVRLDEDVIIVCPNEGDSERRIAYAEMSDAEARAVLHYMGVRLRRLQEEFKKI